MELTLLWILYGGITIILIRQTNQNDKIKDLKDEIKKLSDKLTNQPPTPN